MTRVVLAPHHRLIVTHSETEDTVVVLRPPGCTTEAVLGLARVVLTATAYEVLALVLDHSGGPAGAEP